MTLLEAINQVEHCISVIKGMIPNSTLSTNNSFYNVSDFLSSKIEEMKSHSFLNKGKPYAKNSIQNWMKFHKLWNSFISLNNNNELTFNDISISTYYDFMNFCDSLSFKNSTKSLYAAILKACLSYAYSDGISNNQLFVNRNFKTHIKEEHTKVFLTNAEVYRIASLPLEEKSTLDKVRDVFLVGCYTGLRFSDYSSLSLKDFKPLVIKGKIYQVIEKRQKKTGNDVIIPIIDEDVIRIIEKWGGKLPKVAISTLNSRIKTICKLAGITSTIKEYNSAGGKCVEVVTTKDRVVSSHTARRSCITNLYLEGKLDTVLIRSISGHKTEQAFNRYLCYSSEECAKKIIEKMQCSGY